MVNLQQDKSDIIDTILCFAHAFDAKNWCLLGDCLCDEIHVDYSDFKGDPAAMISREDFVSQRKENLAGLSTQHISTNHLVTIKKDKAKCTSCFLIYRILEGSKEYKAQNMLNSGGHYTHHLVKSAKGWKINYIEQKVVWQFGEPNIHGAFR